MQSRPLKHARKAEDIIPVNPQRVASVILAGGQGTRLGVNGPKGLYEVLGRSLFSHLMEKVPVDAPVAVMTSPMNHDETVSFFQRHGFVASFFQQDVLPLLNDQGESVGLGPDGNGGVYQNLVASGLLDAFEAKGVDTVIISPVDNPLADPVDQRLLAHHRQTGAEVTIKCVERIAGESMGALTEHGIVEYFAIENDVYAFSYVGQVALSTQFIRKAASLDLPYHRVLKKGVWKRERLLFDAFSVADKIEALCYERAACYGPIKGPECKAKTEELLGSL